MKDKCVIGIDIGTQGTKAAIFTAAGQRLAEAFIPSELICIRPGAVSQRPRDLYTSVTRTIRQVVTKSRIPAKDVEAIGIDAQMAGIMAIDKNFEAVGEYDSWLDTRCEPYICQMRRQAEAEIITKTGGPVTYAHGPKILHRKAEHSEEYQRIAKFVLPGVYVAGQLCGLKAEEAWIDYTHLHFTGFADNRNKEWDTGLLQEFGIDISKMPRIISPDTQIGSLCQKAAAECGLLPGTKVAAGCGDSAASALGAGITAPDMIYDVAGTAAIFACSTDRFIPDLENKTILFSRSVIDGLYTPLAYIGGGGLCIRWFRDLHGESYEELNHRAAQIEPGSEELYFVPHFSGRTCPNNPEVRGTYWGLSFCHRPEHLYRSILESIAYEYSHYLAILRRQNPKLQPAFISGAGGGTKSRLFNQLKADALGIPYRPIREADTALYASAMIAAKSAGIITDIKAMMRPSFETESFLPDSRNHEIYQRNMTTYIKLLKALTIQL